MKDRGLQRASVLALAAAISVLFFWMIRDYVIALLLAAIFAGISRPLYLWFVKRAGGRRNLASGLTLLAFVFIIVVPAIGFFGLVTSEAIKVTEDVGPWVKEKLTDKDELNDSLQRLPGYSYIKPYRAEIINKTAGAVAGLGNFTVRWASAITARTFTLLINFAVMLYAMFFFYVNGPAMLERALYYLPLEAADEREILNNFLTIARATLKTLVVIGAVQGALAGFALWAAGISAALFWGTVMAVLSAVPNIGSALVWLPACIFLFLKGETTKAILVLLWCTLVVGTVDNILRPILVGKGTKVPELFVFISTLGGLTLWGLAGFILGPVTAVLFLSIWEIYGSTFKDSLPKN